MIGFTSEQRRMLIDKLADAANLALGALVFGQFVADQPFAPTVAILGMSAWASLLGLALFLGRARWI
jgi:hypothetical protein